MAKAVLCPVCSGTGKIMDYSTTAPVEKTCHGCGGKGWVEVGEECHYYPPYRYPYPDYYYPDKPWYFPDVTNDPYNGSVITI